MTDLNIGNLIFLIVAGFLILLMIQRSEAKRRWLVILLSVPVGWLLIRWARFREQTTELWLALGIALVLNVVFWIVYGRTHPPGSQGEIQVWGSEDV